MANWCQNYLTFQGDEENIKKVTQLFDKMKADEITNNEGQKPDFIGDIEDSYFFNVYTDGEYAVGAFQYETKWSPNPNDVRKIAEHFNLSFVLEYEEFGNNIFGKTKYNSKTKKMTTNDLTDEDFSEIEFDYDNDIYKFRGQDDETDRNFLEELYKERYNEIY